MPDLGGTRIEQKGFLPVGWTQAYSHAAPCFTTFLGHKCFPTNSSPKQSVKYGKGVFWVQPGGDNISDDLYP